MLAMTAKKLMTANINATCVAHALTVTVNYF